MRIFLLPFLLIFSLTIRAQVADFAFISTPSTRCAPIQVQCTDLSTGATSWLWTVTGPDAIPPSTEQFPAFLFIEPGAYNITLQINGGSDEITQSITTYAGPDAEFGLAPGYVANGCIPFEVCFQDLSIPGDAEIVSWQWDLGIPPTATVPNPCVTYAGPLDYDVELVVSDANGCIDFESQEQYVEAFGGEFDFTGGPVLSASCAPLAVDFQVLPPVDPSGLDRITWYFELSDETSFPSGNIIEGVSDPRHFYLQGGPDAGTGNAGYYDVALAVDYNGCTDSIYKDDYVFIGGQTGSFGFEPDSICVGDTVTFFQIGVAGVDSIFWDFDNGNVMNLPVSTDSIQVVYDLTGTYDPIILLKSEACPLIAVTGGEVKVVECEVMDTTGQPTPVVELFSGNGGFEAYPNPSAGDVLVDVKNTSETRFLLSLIDVAGRELKNYEAVSDDGLIILEREGIPSGFYILYLSGKNDPSVQSSIVLVFQ